MLAKPVLMALTIGLACAGPVAAQNTVETLEFSDGGRGAIDWSAEGTIRAEGFGFPTGNEEFEAQKEANARRAAITVTQRRLLEIIQGVAVYGGITMGDAMFAQDVIATNVTGVLQGAVIVEGSEVWDPNTDRYALTMSVPLPALRQAVPPLSVSKEGDPIIISDGSVKAKVRVAPTAHDDDYRVVRGGAIAVGLPDGVLTNDTDANGDPLNVTLVLGVSHGKLAFNRDGSFSYIHNGDSAALDSFVYRANDGLEDQSSLTSNNAVVNIAIAGDEGSSAALTSPSGQAADVQKQPPPGLPEQVTDPGGKTLEEAPPPAVVPETVTEPSGGVPDEETPQSQENLRQAAALSEEAPGVGGKLEPVATGMPTGVILDASQFAVTRQLFMTVYSSSGEVLYDRIEATYIADSPEVAERHEQVADQPEVLEVFTLSLNLVDVVLGQESSERFKELLLQKDYVASGNLVITEKGP